MELSKLILIDFDGTCIPQIIGNNKNNIELMSVDIGSEKILKELISKGHKLILWTLRNSSKDNPYNSKTNDSLEKAIKWFEDRDITLYGINDNIETQLLVGTSRKILGNLLIDDTALGMPIVYGKYVINNVIYDIKHVNWDKVRELLTNLNYL